jgi:peptidoglycan/xylan/chitin deacetylase (PgdA/CDA1 family)
LLWVLSDMPYRPKLAALGLASLVAAGCSSPNPAANDIPVGQAQSAVGVGVPASLPLPHTPKVIYLTFDDGPNPNTTPKVIDTLLDKKVPAVFFITGINIKGNEAIIRREHESGFIVANHQWEHVVASTAQLTVWAPRERDLLDTVLSDGHPDFKHERYFRYPFGSGSTPKEGILKSNGYPDGGIGWNMDALDWCFASKGVCKRPEVPEQFQSDWVGYVKDHIMKHNGTGVILFHDIQKTTAARLPEIIDFIREQGFTFGEFPKPPVGENGAK